MCGIAGLYLPTGAPERVANMDAMLKSMRHRGPTGNGQWRGPGYQAGFARLAIIDLTTGDQPLISAEGERVLMGNGEIYNYLELRARPEARDYPFRTAGDMEPVLALHQAKGEGFVHELNGMYALALFDRRRHSLLLVRDRLGIKPLYWTRLPAGGVLFASEPKALFASGLVDPAIDEQAVADYLAHGWVPAPRTLYAGIHKLPAGHLLRAEADGSIAVERYWRAAPGSLPTDAGDRDEHLIALMDDAIRLQLRSDVPVGALLSGGIDSGLVVALAARALDRPLNTFTVRFAGGQVDETPLARAVAERYGTHHTEFTLSTDAVLDHLPEMAWVCDEPLADASLLPNLLIERELGKHVTVALNGTGGDELFAGYGRYFRLPVEARWMAMPKQLRRTFERLASLADPMLAWRLARAAKRDTDRGGYLHDHSTLFPPPMLRLIGTGLRPGPSAQAACFADLSGDLDTAQLIADMETYLPEDLLLLLDRSSMAVSVEGRVPLLDHRLVEAALAVPPTVRTEGGRQKALLRHLAERFLPAEVIRAPKQGFASPVPAWCAGEFGRTAERLLTSRRALERGWWSASGVRRLAADPARHGFRLYALVMLETVVRLHVEDRRHGLPASMAELCDVR